MSVQHFCPQCGNKNNPNSEFCESCGLELFSNESLDDKFSKSNTNQEYNEIKSSTNKLKHGIDFIEAQKLWEDPYSFEIPSSQNEDEKRFLVLGQIDSKNYTAIITYRDTNIRIISVGRSREKETKLYESIRAR